jgi:hypothetical protein
LKIGSYFTFVAAIPVALLNMTVTLVSAADAIGLKEKAFTRKLTAANCSDFLKRNVIGEISDCGISDIGDFGKVDDHTYYYILYCIIPTYSPADEKCGDDSFSGRHYNSRGLAIHRDKKLYIERTSSDIGLYIYEKPLIVKNSFGTLMHIPIQLDGTGVGNESEYYI